MELDQDKKSKITRLIGEGITDYRVIAASVFEDDALGTRSPEAKAVRDFIGGMTGAGAKHQTVMSERTEKLREKRKENIVLTPDQKEFIDQNVKLGTNLKNLTVLLFPSLIGEVGDNRVHYSPQFKSVNAYVKANHADFLVDSESAFDEDYIVPRTIASCIKKVNRWVGKDLKEESLSLKDRRCMDKLLLYLQSPRFVQNYNTYTSASDKEVYESEYVRATWDKPDLTVDEINMYVNVCMDYINLKQIDIKKNRINRIFEAADDQQDMSMRLAEMLKTIGDEYNQCSKRIEAALQKLNGERAKRIANIQQNNASILNLTELFQEEQERMIMLKRAEIQKQLVVEVADEIESMSAWKARVLGISKSEAI